MRTWVKLGCHSMRFGITSRNFHRNLKDLVWVDEEYFCAERKVQVRQGNIRNEIPFENQFQWEKAFSTLFFSCSCFYPHFFWIGPQFLGKLWKRTSVLFFALYTFFTLTFELVLNFKFQQNWGLLSPSVRDIRDNFIDSSFWLGYMCSKIKYLLML
jgi:hypothetical protein